ncbi:MAG TPA: VOC family protein [Candidatus Elarobacter sp.]
MTGRVMPFLWFDGTAEEAVNFYVSIFDDAKIVNVSRYTELGPEPEGTVMTVTFELFGNRFIALNGGSNFSFTPAVSFMVTCETQDEIDRYWDALLEGGTPLECGWITDKYGVTWQITPKLLVDLLGDEDDERKKSVYRAMFEMTKLDIAGLEAAAALQVR